MHAGSRSGYGDIDVEHPPCEPIQEFVVEPRSQHPGLWGISSLQAGDPQLDLKNGDNTEKQFVSVLRCEPCPHLRIGDTSRLTDLAHNIRVE